MKAFLALLLLFAQRRTGHHTFEEAPAIIKLAAEKIHQIVNRAPALEHQLLKVFECYFLVRHLPSWSQDLFSSDEKKLSWFKAVAR